MCVLFVQKVLVCDVCVICAESVGVCMCECVYVCIVSVSVGVCECVLCQ